MNVTYNLTGHRLQIAISKVPGVDPSNSVEGPFFSASAVGTIMMPCSLWENWRNRRASSYPRLWARSYAIPHFSITKFEPSLSAIAAWS